MTTDSNSPETPPQSHLRRSNKILLLVLLSNERHTALLARAREVASAMTFDVFVYPPLPPETATSDPGTDRNSVDMADNDSLFHEQEQEFTLQWFRERGLNASGQFERADSILSTVLEVIR